MESNRKKAVITLDLEPDYAGQIPETYHLWTKNNFHQLTDFLERNHIPLTSFIVGSSIPNNRKMIQFLQRQRVEFHLHSYSHNFDDPDSQEEISKGKEVYEKYFGSPPLGYRAPEGRITTAGLQRVKKHNFLFEASVSPTYWPFLRNILIKPQTLYQPMPDIWEIPFTVIGPYRILFTLSWVKLLGWNIYQHILHSNRLPNIVIFNFHLHDLWQAPGYSSLSPFWKFIYSRHHQAGFDYFQNIIDYLKSKHYQFTTMTKLIPKSK